MGKRLALHLNIIKVLCLGSTCKRLALSSWLSKNLQPCKFLQLLVHLSICFRWLRRFRNNDVFRRLLAALHEQARHPLGGGIPRQEWRRLHQCACHVNLGPVRLRGQTLHIHRSAEQRRATRSAGSIQKVQRCVRQGIDRRTDHGSKASNWTERVDDISETIDAYTRLDRNWHESFGWTVSLPWTIRYQLGVNESMRDTALVLSR